MPAKTDFSTFNCSLAKALAIVGDGWSLLVVREAFLGVRTFGDLQKGLGIAKNILSDRLDRLVTGGVLERSDTARATYSLTAMGRDLIPALVAMMQWGDRWLADGRPPMLLQGADGAGLDTMALTAGGRPIDVRDVEVLPGPGADARTKAFLEMGLGKTLRREAKRDPL